MRATINRPEPPPPPPGEVVLVMSEGEATILRELAGYDVSVVRALEQGRIFTPSYCARIKTLLHDLYEILDEVVPR